MYIIADITCGCQQTVFHRIYILFYALNYEIAELWGSVPRKSFS